jgi:hypothetical protein
VAVAIHLADKRALARMGGRAVARRLGPMMEAGLVGTCGIIELEVRFSARSHTEYQQIRLANGLCVKGRSPEQDPIPDGGLSARVNCHSHTVSGPSTRHNEHVTKRESAAT